MAAGQHWDIFCTVVDNYGDIGVSWRLARQLALEHGLQVRLWVDDLDSFRALVPGLNPALPMQTLDQVEVRHWTADFPSVTPAEVVIDAFGCTLPDSYLRAMAAQQPAPVWVNLEYLSAETWVAGCHGLPSPHPRLPLTQYFYFPGFSADSGGLLHESGLRERRSAFQAAPDAFWTQLNLQALPGALRVSLFGYENRAVTNLLAAWQHSAQPVQCLLPQSKLLGQVAQAVGAHALTVGERQVRGQLTLDVLPFVSQLDYDKLLWACDLNFVRGEDSLVRALLAGRPLVWHIYPQADDAHWPKLKAFLALYETGLSPAACQAQQALWFNWNRGQLDYSAWQDYAAQLPELMRHAETWAQTISAEPGLSTKLVRFCQSKLK
jgi:uncharacterized repeat protein (TIGR03837 family)